MHFFRWCGTLRKALIRRPHGGRQTDSHYGKRQQENEKALQIGTGGDKISDSRA